MMRPVWKRMRSILPLYAPHVAIFSSSDLYCIVPRSGAARCAPPPVLPVGSVCGCMAVELAGGCSAEYDPARRPGAVASARAHLLPLHRVRLFLTPSHVLSSPGRGVTPQPSPRSMSPRSSPMVSPPRSPKGELRGEDAASATQRRADAAAAAASLASAAAGHGGPPLPERDVSAVEIWAKWVETGVDNQVFPRSPLRLRQKMVTTEFNDQCGVLETRRRIDTRACTPERNRLPGQALARGRTPSRCLLVYFFVCA